MPLLGVLGYPVAHSRSPALQEAGLRAIGLDDWHYQRLPVPPQLFGETVRALPGLGFIGANVTIPHKSAALALADEVSDRARAIGAANTLAFRDGAIAAENTDAPGFLAAVGGDVAGQSALVLGAGGSARAVVWALVKGGAGDVMVWNRTSSRARELCDQLGGRAVREPQPADLLVNCTAVGMGADGSAFKPGVLNADDVSDYRCVVDLAYGSEQTALVAAARARRLSVVDGLDVLVHQGALSFELWTGRRAPIAEMRRGIERSRSDEATASPPRLPG